MYFLTTPFTPSKEFENELQQWDKAKDLGVY
jgi:hypothetical protein